MVNELEYRAFVCFYLLDEPTWQAIDGLRHLETIQFPNRVKEELAREIVFSFQFLVFSNQQV